MQQMEAMLETALADDALGIQLEKERAANIARNNKIASERARKAELERLRAERKKLEQAAIAAQIAEEQEAKRLGLRWFAYYGASGTRARREQMASPKAGEVSVGNPNGYDTPIEAMRVAIPPELHRKVMDEAPCSIPPGHDYMLCDILN